MISDGESGWPSGTFSGKLFILFPYCILSLIPLVGWITPVISGLGGMLLLWIFHARLQL